MHRKVFLLALATVIIFGFASAHACPDCGGKGVINGDFALLGNGIVRSWVKLDEEGNPTAVAVTMTETALEGLAEKNPEDRHELEYLLNLPPEAAATGIDHIGINWNPEGHIPPGIYDVPHFDVHFYLISREERQKIVKDEENLPKFQVAVPEKFVPPGYFYAPESEEPTMGAHWVDTATPELNGEPFTATYIWGSYEGRMVFLEPMITREFLASRPNVTMPVKQPAAVQKDAMYPTEWSISCDEQRREITIALLGLKKRNAEK